MVPGKYNIVCPQGSTFSQDLTYRVNDALVDLSSYEIRMQVREKYTSTSAVVSLDRIAGITVPSLGTIRITVAATTTATWIPKEYVYDIELVSPSGVVSRILEGKFIVTPEVTR